MSNKTYLHIGQALWWLNGAKDSINICARRFGKSYMVALTIMRNVLEMPGSTGVFIASSFRQAHARTLPSALQAMEAFGWHEGVHFIIGKKPDPRMGFKSPHFLPSDLHDVIWFANGTIMIIISQEVVLSANSLTIHWAVGDEAKGLDYDKLSNEVFPAIGGSSVYYNDPAKYPHLWGVHFFTDMPATKDGLWLIRKYEDKYDKDLNDTIIGLECKRQRLMLQEPNTYNTREIAWLSRSINLMRNKALYYQERSIFDNIDVVGADYVERCRRDLTDMVFRASILCQRIDETEGKFYQNFSTKLHTYSATSRQKLEEYKNKPYDCRLDEDVDANAPLAISFDYNAQITWLVVSQIQGRKHVTLKSFFTKYNRRLRECVADFCHYYRYHNCKKVILYHDSTALGTNYIEANHDAIFCINDELKKNGWVVVKKYLGNPMAHDKKHLIINNGFSGSEKLFPVFNADNNVELLQAIPLTAYVLTGKGWKKDKSGEKTPESDTNLPYELRTDATDAWDTGFLGCLLMPYEASASAWSSLPQ